MYKRPDSDIFETKQIEQPARIKNDTYFDPNEAFRKKNDQNYQKYNTKIGNVGRKNIQGNPQMTKVNEKVTFDDQYHKDRKHQDMQSSIFYQQKQYLRPQTAQGQKPLTQKSSTNNEAHFGRKNTFKRQIESLPYNQSNMKGNASQLFDFDSKTQNQVEKTDNLILIPHQMQWDQHDSIRYQHNKQQNHNVNPVTNYSNVLQKTEQTKSTEDPKQSKEKKKTLQELIKIQSNNLNQENTGKNCGKKVQAKKQQKKGPSTLLNQVQIKVLRGWDNKFLEGLTKYCKLYSTPMIKFELEGPGKATIFLKKTKKWQAVSDWLVKDAKLKIRVMNT